MSAKLCGVEQRAPPMFGRATITLGIGPHSSFYCLMKGKHLPLRSLIFGLISSYRTGSTCLQRCDFLHLRLFMYVLTFICGTAFLHSTEILRHICLLLASALCGLRGSQIRPRSVSRPEMVNDDQTLALVCLFVVCYSIFVLLVTACFCSVGFF